MEKVRSLFQRNYGYWVLLVPLFVIELVLEPYFPVTHNLVYDWYAFARYLVLFLYGFLFISAGRSFWDRMDRLKFPALVAGIFAFLLMAGLSRYIIDGPAGHLLVAVAKTVNLGAWSVVVFGYGAALLNRPSRLLTYCNRAVYPFYIAHQTITVLAGYFIIDSNWPVVWKFAFLLAVTFAGSWILFELVKRYSFTRIIFGIKKKKLKQKNSAVKKQNGIQAAEVLPQMPETERRWLTADS